MILKEVSLYIIYHYKSLYIIIICIILYIIILYNILYNILYIILYNNIIYNISNMIGFFSGLGNGKIVHFTIDNITGDLIPNKVVL
jgi:hypothetical protein